MLSRLSETICAAGIPLESVSGVPGNPVLAFRPGTTQQQQDAAAAIVAEFDWTQATHDAWLKAKLKPGISSEIDKFTDEGYRLRALAQLIIEEINILRGQIIGVATFTFDPPNIANAAGATSANVTVTGAAFGDVVEVAAPYTLQGLTVTGYVSATDTVNVRLHNGTGGAVNLASGTWKVVVRRHSALPARTLAQAKNAFQNLFTGSALD